MADNIFVQQTWNAIDYEKDDQEPKNSTATIYYIVFGTTDDVAAVAAAEAQAPVNFEGIPYKSAVISERLTETEWKIEVKYAHKQNSDSGDDTDDEEPQFNFDISQGSRHIVTSIKQKAKIPSNAPDSQGINDGEGADIICPVCTISETHWFRPSKITTAWKKKVATMVGCINGSAFWGFSAGELLFTGCSGTRTGDSSKDKWQVTFRFGVQANQSVKIGSLGTISKRGWDLLWARYKEEIKESGGKKIVLRVPKAAYAEQVYEEANFKSLGI